MRPLSALAAISVLAAALVGGARAEDGDQRGFGSTSADHEYVYCDNGVRCIRAPCPSRSARDLTTGEVIRGIHLDLGGLSPEDRQRSDLQYALYHGTLVLGGTIASMTPAPDGRPGATILIVHRIVRPSTDAERWHCSAPH